MLWLILHLILLGYSLLVHHLLAFCGGAPIHFTPSFSIFAAEQISSVHCCLHTVDHPATSAFSDIADRVFHLAEPDPTFFICRPRWQQWSQIFVLNFGQRSLAGSPGPKSGRHQLLPQGLDLSLTLCALAFTGDGGEGCSRTMATAEAPLPYWIHDLPTEGAKQHGPRPQANSEFLSWSSTTSSIKKRSIRRAFRRACRDGVCWYKGRSYTPLDFPQQLQGTQPLQHRPLKPSGEYDLTRYNRKHCNKRRANFVTWNVAGLSQSKLDEVRHWALTQNITALALVETRWPWTSEWQDPHWQYVHSGDPSSRSSGILIMISRTISTDLRWRECLPGRLVHVQLRLSPRYLDFLACYQFCFQSNAMRQADRQRWWECLETTLSRLPRRHVLAIAGDFNCSLTRQTHHIGHMGYHWQGETHQGPTHGDSDTFLHIIRTYDLNVLNSWQPSLGPTYIGQQGHSRIDFCLTRHHMADGCSRAVKYLWNAPFKSSLQDHCPIFFQLNRYWIPAPLTTTQTGCTFQQRVQCRTAYLEDSGLWQDFLHKSMHTVSDHLRQSDPHDTELIPTLHAAVLQDLQQFFPPVSPSQSAVWKSTANTITCKWHYRNHFLRLAGCMHQGFLDLQIFLRFWHHVSRFTALSRLQKRHSRAVRKSRFAEVIALAQTAADRHNTFQLFQLINRFAPKQPRRRMQLRNSQGQLATAVEEHSILCHFVTEVWSGQPTQHQHPDVIAGTPFTEADVRHALETIPISKAVAPGFAPGAVWRALADCLAPRLFSLLQCWWFQASPFIPASWRNGWLCWLPKPGKPPTLPASLRPIALQEPVGKAIMGVLSRVGQSDSLDYMIQWPLWAYLPHRSTLDSLLRVAQHCQVGRTLIQSQRSTPFTRASQQIRHEVCGAAQLLVDMSRAFDSIDRNRLFSRLHEIGVRKELVNILTSWHSDTSYAVRTGPHLDMVPVERGLRQGCKAAPWLWNSILALILTDLSGLIDRNWLCDHTNLYADDIHAGDTFSSETALMTLLRNFAMILSMLRSYGLQINEHKSMILLTMTGPSQSQVRKKILVRRDGGDHLVLSFGDQTFTIPVAHSAKYLCVVISYGNLEDQTVRHRIQLATVAFKRLLVWLTGRRGLAMKDKLQLWTTCVLPIATYGIFSIGITAKGVKLLNTTITLMLRKILMDHSYITRHSNKQVFRLHDIDPPCIVLWNSAERLKRSVTQRCLRLHQHDLVQQLDWAHLHDIQSLLLEMHEAGLQTQPLTSTVEAAEHLHCFQCAFRTRDATILRQHYATVHGHRMFRTSFVTPSDHMLHGLPQCKHCLVSFTTWRRFVTHIERGCQVLRTHPEQGGRVGPTAQMPLLPTRLVNARSDAAMRGQTQLGVTDLRNILSQEWGPRLLRIIGTRQLHLLRQETAITEYLAQRCCLCDQWVGRSQEMHKHLRLFHAAYWPMVMAKSTQLTNIHADESPCDFCKGIFQKSHSCNTWTQVSLLIIYGATNPEQQGDSRGLQCEICDQVFTTPEALCSHLTQAHQLTSARWNQGRDSIDGGSGCAHCGQVFGNMESLRSHISQGRCSSFNPTLTSEPKAVTDRTIQVLCEGGLTEAVQDSHWRLQHTLHCLCCSATYHRAGDLMLHLQCAHSQLWRDSEPLTSIFLGVFYRAWGCICNPTTTVKRLNHVCPALKQLSMQFLRLPPHKILMPLLMTEQMLTQALSPQTPSELRFAVERALQGLGISLGSTSLDADNGWSMPTLWTTPSSP